MLPHFDRRLAVVVAGGLDHIVVVLREDLDRMEVDLGVQMAVVLVCLDPGVDLVPEMVDIAAVLDILRLVAVVQVDQQEGHLQPVLQGKAVGLPVLPQVYSPIPCLL